MGDKIERGVLRNKLFVPLLIINAIAIWLFVLSIYSFQDGFYTIHFANFIFSMLIIFHSITYLVFAIKNKIKIAYIFMKSAFYTFLLGTMCLWAMMLYVPILIIFIIAASIIPLILYFQYRLANKNKLQAKNKFLIPLALIDVITTVILIQYATSVFYIFKNNDWHQVGLKIVYIICFALSLMVILCSIVYFILAIAKKNKILLVLMRTILCIFCGMVVCVFHGLFLSIGYVLIGDIIMAVVLFLSLVVYLIIKKHKKPKTKEEIPNDQQS